MRVLVFGICLASVVYQELADAAEQAACTITANLCKNFPQFTRKQFRDVLGEEHAETGTNEAACLKRAEDFHHWCGNGREGGVQVAATYGAKRWTQLYHPGACDEGWSQWDAFCYKYYWEMKTWPEAEELCRQRGAHLVSIHSQAENRFVAVLQHGLKGWIGYTDIDKDTHYEWSDNTQDDFTNFAKNCTGRENDPDCKPEEVQQQWYSSSGASTSPYTCKRNALISGLELLKNTSAQQLLEVSWSELLPALNASAFAPGINVSSAGAALSLKVEGLPKPTADTNARSASKETLPEPRLRMPKGSFV
eukprot:TRINITY_DN29995_c0_g1_i1.p1 TRINITY_DN29995_c0_g1~~TRINITY_DN29995_c0_g1_i1.p1  ORF type:complete len:307 (-),score=69.51 TRINITY_DN29995_c0_g1_i1:77-997(-)